MNSRSEKALPRRSLNLKSQKRHLYKLTSLRSQASEKSISNYSLETLNNKSVSNLPISESHKLVSKLRIAPNFTTALFITVNNKTNNMESSQTEVDPWELLDSNPREALLMNSPVKVKKKAARAICKRIEQETRSSGPRPKAPPRPGILPEIKSKLEGLKTLEEKLDFVTSEVFKPRKNRFDKKAYFLGLGKSVLEAYRLKVPQEAKTQDDVFRALYNVKNSRKVVFTRELGATPEVKKYLKALKDFDTQKFYTTVQKLPELTPQSLNLKLSGLNRDFIAFSILSHKDLKNLKYLNLKGNSLQDTCCSLILCMLTTHSKNLSCLNLNSTNISGASALAISVLLGRLDTLTCLDIGNNSIDDQAFSSIVMACCDSNLECLKSTQVPIGVAGAIGIGKLLRLSRSLKVLDISKNSLRGEPFKHICRGLLGGTLSVVYLDECQLRDSDLKELKSAIKSRTLIMVSVKSNQLTIKGLECLFEELKLNKKLQHLAISGNSQISKKDLEAFRSSFPVFKKIKVANEKSYFESEVCNKSGLKELLERFEIT